MSLRKLLKRAKMTEDQLPPSEAEAFEAMSLAIAEVTEVRDQIRAEQSGMTDRCQRDPSWHGRATSAVVIMQAKANALRCHYNRLRAAREKQEAETRRANRVENKLREQAAAQRRAAKAKCLEDENAAIVMVIQSHLKSLRKLIKKLPEEDRKAFYDLMEAAQNEVRAKYDAERKVNQ